MKKKGFVAAAMAAVLASSMLSVPASAWSKDDIIAGDEYTLIVSYHWSGIVHSNWNPAGNKKILKI